MIRAAAAVAALAVLAGCETTQQESAQIARRLGHQSARAGTTRIGRVSSDVRVVRSALIAGNPAAVALELTSSAPAAQAAIPVLVNVRDSRGAVVYRNDTSGIEPSLQQFALLRAHATVWWVDNEVLASGGAAASVTAQIGASGSAAQTQPALAVDDVSASDSFPGPHVQVTLRNGGAARSQLPVYAVALRGASSAPVAPWSRRSPAAPRPRS
jgi:hypothetical protein